MKKEPVFITGKNLQKLIQRNGTLYPIKTYICPQRLSKMGIVYDGKEVYSYSIDEAYHILCEHETAKIEEKNQKLYDNYLPKKGIDPYGDDNE